MTNLWNIDHEWNERVRTGCMKPVIDGMTFNLKYTGIADHIHKFGMMRFHRSIALSSKLNFFWLLVSCTASFGILCETRGHSQGQIDRYNYGGKNMRVAIFSWWLPSIWSVTNASEAVLPVKHYTDFLKELKILNKYIFAFPF